MIKKKQYLDHHKLQLGVIACLQYIFMVHSAGNMLYVRPANERPRYNITSSLIGWAHIQNDPCTAVGKFLTPLLLQLAYPLGKLG